MLKSADATLVSGKLENFADLSIFLELQHLQEWKIFRSKRKFSDFSTFTKIRNFFYSGPVILRCFSRSRGSENFPLWIIEKLYSKIKSIGTFAKAVKFPINRKIVQFYNFPQIFEIFQTRYYKCVQFHPLWRKCKKLNFRNFSNCISPRNLRLFK